MSLIQAERQTYETAWSINDYGKMSPGETNVPLFLDMAHPTPGVSILDAGCGSGRGALALRDAGFHDIILCDLTPAGLLPEAHEYFAFVETVLWKPLPPAVGRFDWVYCCDVLEHIPPTFTMLVAARLLEVAKRGVFFSIALMPDNFGAFVGKPLHQTIQPFQAWKEQFNALGRVVECRDLLAAGIFLVAAK